MFKSLSIRTGLTLATGVFVLLVLAVGACAWVSLDAANGELDSMYRNDLTATSALSRSSEQLLRCRSAKNRYESLVGQGNDDGAAKQMALAQGYCGASQKAWDAFMTVPVDAEMQSVLHDADEKHKAMMAQGINPEFDVLRAHDFDGYHRIQLQFSSPLYNAFDKLTQPLAEYAEKRAQQRYDDAQSRAHLVFGVLIGCAVLAVAIAFVVRRALTQAVVSPVGHMVDDFTRISSGDLQRPIHVHGENEIGQLQAGLRRMQHELAETVRKIRASTQRIHSASSEIAAGNTDLSARTEQQAASLEETAASMEQITGTVRQNAENARQATQLANSAAAVAGEGSDVMNRVVGTMSEINKGSTKIADIVNIIEGIAFQTNILALNAAVEAARAGESGRGFAVVAGEVRTLAQRSSTAAKEIKELIDQSVSSVGAGAALVEQAGKTMGEIHAAVQRVTDIMGEISSASDEQSRGIDQISKAVTQMDEVTQQNAALVEEAAAASQALESEVGALNASVAVFRLA